jgi:adenine-specific DNA-methyltransferase
VLYLATRKNIKTGWRNGKYKITVLRYNPQNLGTIWEVVKYIGSKRVLLPWICSTAQQIGRLDKLRTVLDLFSGTSRVAHAFKAMGLQVTASDLQTYAHVLAQTLVQADADVYSEAYIQPILDRLMERQAKAGWFTQTYCVEAKFFQPHNGAKLESIRSAIDKEAGEDPVLRAILLYSLMVAADKVDSTTGIHMSYLKKWSSRSYNQLKLAYPPLLRGTGMALQGDALEVAQQHRADLVYLDPPYNQHSYSGNYHLWETLVRWDNPPTYGIARKRLDVKENKSLFNSRRSAKGAMEKLLLGVQAKHIVMSFSNEGFFTTQEIQNMLSGWGYVIGQSQSYRRYIGAKIGIYNPKGQKVGQVSHTQNQEYLFVATQSKKVYQALRDKLK